MIVYDLQELELTLPPFTLVPSQRSIVPMVSLHNGKVYTSAAGEERDDETMDKTTRIPMVSE